MASNNRASEETSSNRSASEAMEVEISNNAAGDEMDVENTVRQRITPDNATDEDVANFDWGDTPEEWRLGDHISPEPCDQAAILKLKKIYMFEGLERWNNKTKKCFVQGMNSTGETESNKREPSNHRVFRFGQEVTWNWAYWVIVRASYSREKLMTRQARKKLEAKWRGTDIWTANTPGGMTPDAPDSDDDPGRPAKKAKARARQQTASQPAQPAPPQQPLPTLQTQTTRQGRGFRNTISDLLNDEPGEGQGQSSAARLGAAIEETLKEHRTQTVASVRQLLQDNWARQLRDIEAAIDDRIGRLATE